MKQAEAKGTMTNLPPHISPALIETYSRLLVYTEIESLGIKGFLSRLLPTVCKSNAWSILYTLLEMFSYRLFHIQVKILKFISIIFLNKNFHHILGTLPSSAVVATS
jgi:hypothetical protein